MPAKPASCDCRPHARAALAHLLLAQRALKATGGRLQAGAVRDARRAILDAERAILRITQGE